MLKRLLILLLLATPVLATVQGSSEFDAQAENEIVKYINQERTQRGLPPVSMDDRLTRAARHHTELMVENRELTHKLSDERPLRERVADTGIDFRAAGENVAYDVDAKRAHEAFMLSPGHRANVLQEKFNAVGIGVIHKGDLIWVTEDFAQRKDTTSASEAASIVMTKYAELRKTVGSPAATEHAMPRLGTIACDMAKKDKLDTQTPRGLANMRGVVAWTADDPAKIPAQVKKLADDRQATTYSLGVCYASSASYPTRVFWFVLAIY